MVTNKTGESILVNHQTHIDADQLSIEFDSCLEKIILLVKECFWVSLIEDFFINKKSIIKFTINL